MALSLVYYQRAPPVSRPGRYFPTIAPKCFYMRTTIWRRGSSRGRSPPRIKSNAPQSLAVQGAAARVAGTFVPRSGTKVTALFSLSKKSGDFFDRLTNAVTFAPHCGAVQKSPLRALRGPHALPCKALRGIRSYSRRAAAPSSSPAAKGPCFSAGSF